MTETYFIFVLLLLVTTVAALIFHIRRLKRKHQEKLRLLYQYLTDLNEKLKQADGKITIETNYKKSLNDARVRLNKEIFDLQMSVFEEKYGK